MSGSRTPTPAQILNEAADWLVLMREPSVSTQDREAFAEWLRVSPVHVGAYIESAKLWSDAAHLDPEMPMVLTASPAANVVPLRDGAADFQHTRRARSRGPRPRMLAVAASAVLAVVGASLAWWYYTANAYVTDIGEQRVITLEDSSIVRLNSRSRLRVRMTPEARLIELSQGEALFEVAHDTARPFIVRSANITVRAVGTQFDVNRKTSATVVTVVEGRVKIGTLAPSESPRAVTDTGVLLVSAGEQVKVAHNGTVQKAGTADISTATSWLRQELHFEGQPLSDVLEEFNRYARVPIVLTDPTLSTLRINAVFHTTSPESLLHYLAGLDGVEVERSDKEIRVSKRR